MVGTVVIKYGGSAMDDPAKVGEILAEIAGLARGGVPIVLVHGGGKEISAEMKKRGLKPVFVEGFRVTNEATMVAVEEVLDGKVNPAIVAQLNGQGGKARGMSGRKVFLARKAAAGLAEGGHPCARESNVTCCGGSTIGDRSAHGNISCSGKGQGPR